MSEQARVGFQITNAKMVDFLTGSFEDWLKEVDRLFLERTNCTWADLCGDEEPVRSAFAAMETPLEFVGRICTKFDLG